MSDYILREDATNPLTGSDALYAPGNLTPAGVAVPEPPTCSWKQDM